MPNQNCVRGCGILRLQVHRGNGYSIQHTITASRSDCRRPVRAGESAQRIVTTRPLPAEAYAGGPDQRQNRMIHIRKLIMRKPTHVQRLFPDIRIDKVIREHEILHVEVVGGPDGTAGDLVLGQQ